MKDLTQFETLAVLLLNLFYLPLSFSQKLSGPAEDQSVAWQNTISHNGLDQASPLVPPLTLKWQQDLSSIGVSVISYPIIAQGLIIVTVTSDSQIESLLAFDEATGTQVWSADVDGIYGFANACYDSGRVFVNNCDGLMKAFEAVDGTLLWSVDLPNQTIFTSPPTAANGIVYTAGSGVGGTLYAVDEQSGNVIWMSGIENGDHTSPALDYESVFVSCACSQTYSFEASTGKLAWFFVGSCQGGGGRTAVAHSGRIYVRDTLDIYDKGLVLDARSGIQVGEFRADVPPALFKDTAFYLREGTLRAVDINTGNILWSFEGDGRLTSAPLIVNRTIYIGSSRGRLFALDSHGQPCWSTSVGVAIRAPDEHNLVPTTGLGAGDGLLVVPAGSILAVYGN